MKLEVRKLSYGNAYVRQICHEIGDTAEIQDDQRRGVEEPADADSHSRWQIRHAIVQVDSFIFYRHVNGFIERDPGERHKIAGAYASFLLEMMRKCDRKVS